MKVMSSYIEIGNYIFRQNAGVRVSSSWKEMTDTAEVRLPNFGGNLETKIKVGDAVLIRLGYDGELLDEFSGYISERTAESPMTFTCEDEMWQLKQKEVTKAWKTVTLKEVVAFLVPGTTVDFVPDITLAPFRLNQVSIYEALKELKKNYNIVVYFRKKQLIVGSPYGEQLPRVKYKFSSTDANANTRDLKYRLASDIRIKLRAISILPDNTKIEVSDLGDSDGEVRTLHFYNLNEAELRKQAAQKIDYLKYDGYGGTFQAMGRPYATHGMVAEIYDDKYQERAGNYFIDETEVEYNHTNGYKRYITLGKKA